MAKAVADAIVTQSTEWERCYHKKEWKKLSELYTDDCKVYPPGRSIAIGRAECARAWQGLGESGVDRIVLDCLETQYSDGNMAADRSTFVMYDVNGKQIDNGESVVIWRRVTDKRNKKSSPTWQLHYDIFNTVNSAKKDAKTVITEQSAKWEHFYQLGDMRSLSLLYTPDCKVFPPGKPVAVGRIACERAWTRLYESGVKYIKLQLVQSHDMGDGLASDHTNFVMFDARGKQIDHGKYVVIWKRLEDGQWYLHFDIFNSDTQ